MPGLNDGAEDELHVLALVLRHDLAVDHVEQLLAARLLSFEGGM
jgi:hypothetical protein